MVDKKVEWFGKQTGTSYVDEKGTWLDIDDEQQGSTYVTLHLAWILQNSEEF